MSTSKEALTSLMWTEALVSQFQSGALLRAPMVRENKSTLSYLRSLTACSQPRIRVAQIVLVALRFAPQLSARRGSQRILLAKSELSQLQPSSICVAIDMVMTMIAAQSCWRMQSKMLISSHSTKLSTEICWWAFKITMRSTSMMTEKSLCHRFERLRSIIQRPSSSLLLLQML